MTDKHRTRFDQLIKQYKVEKFKETPIISHQFLYTFFHPLKSDQVVCLERNTYPEDLDIVKLKPIGDLT